jgi:hypothetical protein
VTDALSLVQGPLWRSNVLRVLRRMPGMAAVERIVRRLLFTRDLRRLNDVLARTPLDGRYRVFGGVLLGWAREGRLLAHDLNDADFAYDADDDESFLAAVPDLCRAGFRPLFRYRSNDGRYTEHCFRRRGAIFEFFRLERSDGRHRYHIYGIDPEDAHEHVEMVCEVPAQRWVPFEFLGRRWLKPAMHEAELEAVYGDWRTPDPAWSFLDEGTTVDRRRWNATDYVWR